MFIKFDLQLVPLLKKVFETHHEKKHHIIVHPSNIRSNINGLWLPWLTVFLFVGCCLLNFMMDIVN